MADKRKSWIDEPKSEQARRPVTKVQVKTTHIIQHTEEVEFGSSETLTLGEKLDAIIAGAVQEYLNGNLAESAILDSVTFDGLQELVKNSA